MSQNIWRGPPNNPIGDVEFNIPALNSGALDLAALCEYASNCCFCSKCGLLLRRASPRRGKIFSCVIHPENKITQRAWRIGYKKIRAVVRTIEESEFFNKVK